MNRALVPAADGLFVLRPGRHYRLLVIVNGPTTCDDLEAALVRGGFHAPVASAPQDWDAERPGDWPAESLFATAVNECLVRVSGVLRTSAAGVRFDRDHAIETGATFTIAQAWDYGAAPEAAARETTGLAPSPPSPKADDKSPKVLAIAAVAGLGIGLYSMWRSSRRYERDEARYTSLQAKAEREELARRVEHYLQHGHSSDEAERLAEREVAAREARKLVAELEG
jgi:hypothetical protein